MFLLANSLSSTPKVGFVPTRYDCRPPWNPVLAYSELYTCNSSSDSHSHAAFADVAAAVERLDRLVKRFEEHPDPVVKDLVFELLSAVDAVHRIGLRRLNELLKVAGLQHRATDDPEVRLLFDLYDLGEGGDEARCAAVVESVKPGLDARGVQIELVASTATTIRVRLTCPPHAE
jgi:hypothetical protein